MAVINTIKELLPLNPLYGEELKYFLNRFGPDDPARLADFAASLTTSDKQELQEVLEKTHIRERMEKAGVEQGIYESFLAACGYAHFKHHF